MDERDPTRWTHSGADVPGPIQQILRSAAADQPAPAQLDRFVGRVKSALASPPPSAAAARLVSAKSVGAVALVAGGALLAWLALSPRHAPNERATPAADHAAAAEAPSLPTAPPGPSGRSRPEPAPPPEPSAAPSPAPPPAAPPAPAPTSTPSRSASAGPGRTAQPEPRSADTLDEEVRLLQGARDRLAADPAGALRFADQHRVRFPRGVLAQEREIISIEALSHQGRDAEAQARADRFRRSYPGSAHLDRLPARVDPGHN